MSTNVTSSEPASHANDRLGTQPGQQRHIQENVGGNVSSKHTPRRSIDVLEYGQPEYSRNSPKSQNYSEDVADRNMSSSTNSDQTMSQQGLEPHSSERKPLTQSSSKGEVLDQRKEDTQGPIPYFVSSFSHGNEDEADHASALKRKPVASIHAENSDTDVNTRQSREPHPETHKLSANEHSRKSNVAKEPTVESITDTMVRTHIAPAVTHETIQPVVHEIQSKKITREIHNYDVIHREQPIKVVENLPPRHFIRSSSGTLTEVPATGLPDVCRDSWTKDQKPLPPTPNV